MTPLAQTTLQPEALGVLVVLAVALLSLVVVAIALVRSRRRRAAHVARLAADAPEPRRFDGMTPEDVLGVADAGLYQRRATDVTDAALWLDGQGHPQALPYLLHALRQAPTHHREALVAAAAAHPPEELAAHPLLAAAIEPDVLTALRDRMQAKRSPPPPSSRGRQRRLA